MRRSPLFIIFITVFINLVGFGIVIPVLPIYAASPRFDASPVAIGLLFASYSIMQLIFSPILGRLSDRYGRRPVLFLSLLGTGVAFWILGSARALWMLFVGRILDGITGGNISTAQAYVADITAPEERAKGMGVIGAAFGLGFIFGPALGGMLSRWGESVPFFFASALAFASAFLLYFLLPETVLPGRHHATAARSGWRDLVGYLRRPPLSLVLIIYFLFVTSFSILTTTFALFTMYRFGFDAQHNGYLFAFTGLIGVIVQGALLSRVVRFIGESALALFGNALFGLGMFLIPFLGPRRGGLEALLLVLSIQAIGNALAMPTLNSLTSKSAGAGEQGGVLGVAQSVASLARIVGPILGSWLLYDASAPQKFNDHTIRLAYWGGAALALIAALLSWRLIQAFAPNYERQKTASTQA